MSLSDCEAYFGPEAIADCYDREEKYEAEKHCQDYVGNSDREICNLVKRFFPKNETAYSNLKNRTYSCFMIKKVEKDKGEVHLTIECPNDPTYEKTMTCSHVSVKTVTRKVACVLGSDYTELSVHIYLFGSESLEFKYERRVSD